MLSNVVTAIEQHVDWMTNLMSTMDRQGSTCRSRPRAHMPYVGGMGPYRQFCDDVAADGYRGFELRTARAAPAATG